MTKSWFAVGAAILMLAGCAPSARPLFPHRYALTGPAAPATERRGGTRTGEMLRVDRIAMPVWLQGTDLDYRLGYRNGNRIAAYADSEWAAPPAGMLERIIRNSLAHRGAWRVVLGPDDPARADMSLHVRVDDFIQVFTTPQQSYGVLDATATLVDARDDNAVAQRRFHVRVAAPSANAAGGVQALERASRQFAADLETWIAAVAAPDAPGGRGSPAR